MFCGSVFCPCFVIQYSVSFLFCNHLDGEERAGCFTLTVFLMALSHGAAGSSGVFPVHTQLLAYF